MPVKHVIDIREGDVFVTPAQASRSGFRRVLGVLDGRVRYSVGGDHNRTCKVTTFKRWIRTMETNLAKHDVTHHFERDTVSVDTGIGILELTAIEAMEFPPDFWEWLKENKSVYAGFVEIAREGHRRGLRKWGAFAVINVLRWQTAIREVDSQFKVNNNRAPLLARLCMLQFPELKGVFSIRELRTR